VTSVFGFSCQHCSGLHDLPGLTEAALRHVSPDARLFAPHGRRSDAKPSDRCYFTSRSVRDRCDTRAYSLSIDHDGAGAATRPDRSQTWRRSIPISHAGTRAAEVPDRRPALFFLPFIFHFNHDVPRSFKLRPRLRRERRNTFSQPPDAIVRIFVEIDPSRQIRKRPDLISKKPPSGRTPPGGSEPGSGSDLILETT